MRIYSGGFDERVRESNSQHIYIDKQAEVRTPHDKKFTPSKQGEKKRVSEIWCLFVAQRKKKSVYIDKLVPYIKRNGFFRMNKMPSQVEPSQAKPIQSTLHREHYKCYIAKS